MWEIVSFAYLLNLTDKGEIESSARAKINSIVKRSARFYGYHLLTVTLPYNLWGICGSASTTVVLAATRTIARTVGLRQ